MVHRALSDKTYWSLGLLSPLMTFPPEPLVHFTELFLMTAPTKIAQIDLLGLIQGLPEL